MLRSVVIIIAHRGLLLERSGIIGDAPGNNSQTSIITSSSG